MIYDCHLFHNIPVESDPTSFLFSVWCSHCQSRAPEAPEAPKGDSWLEGLSAGGRPALLLVAVVATSDFLLYFLDSSWILSKETALGDDSDDQKVALGYPLSGK